VTQSIQPWSCCPVEEHIGELAKQPGDEITIRRFVRFQVGEAAT